MAFIPPPIDENELELYLPDVGRGIDKWVDYRFNSHFTTPTDAFSLTVAGDALDPVMEDGLVCGARVMLRVAGCTQATGFIDSVDRDGTVGEGTTWHLEGRDMIGQAVDSGIDPRIQFKDTEHLSDLLRRVYTPFGWSRDDQFIVDAAADQEIKTGRKLTKPRPPAKHPRKSKLPQLKPNPGEGAHEFAVRVAKRFGLTIWPSADGERIIVGKPYFDQYPTYRLVRRKRGDLRENNIVTAKAKFSIADQPSVIVADGVGGGNEFGKSKLRCIMVNPAVLSDNDELARISRENPRSKVIYPITNGTVMAYTPLRNPRAKPLYIHDENSKTLEQLEEFTRRSMMERVRKTLTYNATVVGHSQLDASGNPVPWAIDTVVDVYDEVTNVVEPMWILSRTFGRGLSGTFTELEMIRLYSLEL